MSFSFDPTLPASLDSVRSLLRDNVEDGAVLSDEEINANLANNGWNDGLALCATTMASEFALRASRYKAGSQDAEFQWEERVDWYKLFASEARKGAYPPPSATVRPVAVAVVTPYEGAGRVRRQLLGGRCWDELI